MGTPPPPQQQNSNSESNQTPLSFDDVSNFFNLPLSEAADTVGVPMSVLKQICYDNGLVRWPYRKFLSGNSIEEIKKEAGRGRNKEPSEWLKTVGERNDVLANSAAASSPGTQLQSKNSNPMQEMTNPRGITKQQGNKNTQNSVLQRPNLSNATPTDSDEFKYGFPSDGLSVASNKWWGESVSDVKENVHKSRDEDDQLQEQQSNDDSSLFSMDGEKSGSGIEASNIGSQDTVSFAVVRRRAVEEGRRMKLGIYRDYGVKKLSRRERVLLLGIFKSSLPTQCEAWFS